MEGAGADAAADADAGDAGKDGAAADEAKADEPGVPDKYEFTVSDGFELDTALLDEATPVLKELGLSNERAQKLAPLAEKVASATVARIVANNQATIADWAKTAKEDPEIGGKNWETTEALVAKALDNLGYPKGSPFRKTLTETGFGNHPEMIRAWRKVGESISEETAFPRGDTGAPVPKSREAQWYPGMVEAK